MLKVNTIKRFGSKEESWNTEMFMEMRGTPWEPTPGHEGVEVKASLEWAKKTESPKPVVEPEDKAVVRRRLGIRKGDVESFGATPGCPGCMAAATGIRRDHTANCRKRMEGMLSNKGDLRVERYAQRATQEA